MSEYTRPSTHDVKIITFRHYYFGHRDANEASGYGEMTRDEAEAEIAKCYDLGYRVAQMTMNNSTVIVILVRNRDDERRRKSITRLR